MAIVWSLTLADGTKIENLSLDCNQFQSEEVIDRGIFTKENISRMEVDCDEETKKKKNLESYLKKKGYDYSPGTFIENVYLDAYWDLSRNEGGVGCAFSFVSKTPQMMLNERMTNAEKSIDTQSIDITDIQEALVDIYETILDE